MKNILETIILNLVENKDAVAIAEKQENQITVFEVTVAKEDIGKVIGRQGKIAQSIRGVVKALATKENKRVRIEFLG